VCPVVQDAGESEHAADKKLTLPFEPVTLAFKDLKYFVPNPAGSGELQLLHNISGAFQPGVLTALMGASGAGKTTLMDVLAGAYLFTTITP
jgi:ABC-type multidrug transport system ATPase subunit